MRTSALFLIGTGIAGVLAAGAASAQSADAQVCESFPSKPLTLVTAAGPGSSMDITSRQLSEQLSKAAGVAVNVLNKGGAGGSLAFNYVRSEPHDGHTILTMSLSTSLNRYTSGSEFDPEMLDGIALAVADWEVLIVDADAPWKTANDFVAAAREAAQPIVFSGPSVGSVAAVTAFKFSKLGNFEHSYVPSPSGGEAMLGVMGGQIPAAFSEPSESWSQKEGGEILYLGVASPERLDFMPDVPTMREQGYDLIASNWRGFAVPDEVPDCVVEKLDSMFQKAINSDEFTAVAEGNRSSIDYMNAADFDAELDRIDLEAKQIATDLGIL